MNKLKNILMKAKFRFLWQIFLSDGKFLFPIPQNEYEYNEAITDQNPGY